MELLEHLPHRGEWGRIKTWIEAGAAQMGDLYREGVLFPFEELREEYEMSKVTS